jgi:hypothetical protein
MMRRLRCPMLVRYDDIDGRGTTDLVSIGSFDPLTVAVIEPGTEIAWYRSEPNADGLYELAVLVGCAALVFVNGMDLCSSGLEVLS